VRKANQLFFAAAVALFFGLAPMAAYADTGRDIQEWLTAAALIFLRHEAGHYQAGTDLATGFRYTGGGSLGLAYSLNRPPGPKAESRIVARVQQGAVAAGGFVGQQQAVEWADLPTPLYQKSLLLSGAFQAAYVVFDRLQPANTGDIRRMSKSAPDHLVIGSVLVSSMSDLVRGYSGSRPAANRLGLFSDAPSGAVGLAFSGKF